jgi:RNA polymerase sigma-70 factor (ECF subfamily)
MNVTPEPGDEELLLRMRSGDETAFILLYRRRQTAIYRFAYHMTGSTSTAEDVTQDVFLALIRRECGFDPERGNLSGYLFGIARKLVLRHLDRNRSLAQFDGEHPGTLRPETVLAGDLAADLVRREDIAQLRRAILSLPKRYREVVVLCDLEELDYVAAAAALACPVGTIRSRLHRARGLLLEKLSQSREAGPVRSLNPARSLI